MLHPLARLAVPFVLTTLAPSTLGDTEFTDSVPLELVKALIGANPAGTPEIYSDVSDRFPAIDFPDGMTVLGSLDGGYSVSVILASDLSIESMREQLEASFGQAGFAEFNLELPGRMQNGFVTPEVNYFRTMSRYCHDELDYLNLQYLDQQTVRTVRISHQLDQDQRSCAARLEEQTQRMSRAGIRQYMPTLMLPEVEPRNFRPAFGIGSSGGGGEIESRASLNTDWTLEEVYEHFKIQIEEQGWTLDSENLGTASANGAWTQRPEPDMELIGNLNVLKVGDEVFELKFRLFMAGMDGQPRRFIFGN